MDQSSGGSMEQGSISWEELLQTHLISTGSVTGIAVLTKTGSCVYSYGNLSSSGDQKWSQFTDVFSNTSNEAQDAIPRISLTLNNRQISFIVFQKGQSSFYATSAGNLYSLIVNSFPVGVLVCVAEPPVIMSKAVTDVENFCTMLKR